MDPRSPHSETVETPAEALGRLERELAALGAASPAAAALHLRAAHICLSVDGEGIVEQAIEHLLSTFRLDPQLVEARVLLIRALERAGREQELAQFLWDASAAMEGSEERTEFHLRAALLFERCGDAERALEIMRELEQQQINPRPGRGRLELLERLIARFAEQAQHDQELEALRLVLPQLPDERRNKCLRRIAQLELQASRPERAQEAHLAALALRPGSDEALQPVLSFLEEQQDFAGISQALQAAVAISAASPERRELWRRLARLAEEQLASPEEAFGYLWRAWEEGPGGEDAENLKRLCTDLKDWDRYHQVLLREARIALDLPTKVEILQELATFQREVLQDDMAAAETYAGILQLAPDDALAHTARLELFEAHGMAAEHRAAMRRYILQCREPRLKGEWLRRLALLEFEEGNDQQLLSLVEQMGQGEDALQLIEELWTRARTDQRPQTAAVMGDELLERQHSCGLEPQRQIKTLLDLAELCLQSDQPGQAVARYHQVLELQGDHPEARARLKELDHRGQLFDPTSLTLALQAEKCAEQAPSRAIRLLIQAAQIVEHLPHPDQEAITRYLRRAVGLYGSECSAEGRLLESALRAAGLHEELIQVLELEASLEERPRERGSILRALSLVYRNDVGDQVRAVEVLERLSALDPADLETAEQIRQLHGTLGNYRSLAEVLENLLNAATGRDRIPLLAELGQLYSQRLGDQTAALGRYGELLSFVPDHRAALAYCRAHDEEAGEHRSVVVLLCRAAEAAADPLERAEFHHEIALIAEQRLNDLDFAVAQWRQVIELCPADTAPRAELRRILIEVGRWREVAEALLSDVARSLSPEDKVPIYIELASISREHLGDARTAAGYLRLAQQLAPANTAILIELESIFESLEQWHELAVVLRRHAELETALATRVALLNRAARTLFSNLGRADEALAVCRYIREMSAGDRGSATLMGEILTGREQWRELITLLKEQALAEQDPVEKGRLNLELGHLLLERRADSEEASLYFERALELDAGRGDVLPLLRKLYEEQGNWEQLIDLIRRRTSAEGVSIAEKAAALCEMGRITLAQLGDQQGAREAYERALHLDAACGPALTALQELARTREDWREVARLARQEVPTLQDAAQRSRRQLEIATLLRDKLDRPRAAIEALEEAVAEDPANAEAAARLADICFEEEDWERVSDLLEDVVDAGLELAEIHEYFYRLGFACERLDRQDDAFSYYVKSFGHEPLYLPTLDRLVELCYERRQWDNTLRIAEAIVTTYADQKSPRELADLYCRLGLSQLHLAQLEVAVERLKAMVLSSGRSAAAPRVAWLDAAEDWAATPLERQLVAGIPLEVHERVVEAMERCLEHREDHLEGLQVLAALHLSRHNWERGLSYLDRAASAPQRERRACAELLVCGGDVAFHQLRSRERAEGLYREALDILPGFPLAQERMKRVKSGPPPSPPAGPPPSPQEATQPLPPPQEATQPLPPPIPHPEPRKATEPPKRSVLRVDTPPPPPSFHLEPGEDVSMPTIPIKRSAPRSKPLSALPKKDPPE